MPNQSPEEIARDVIDAQLEVSGWVVQDKTAIDFSKGEGQAIREYQTDTGPADYVLFVDGKPVGVVEAKKDTLGQNITTVEEQTVEYAAASLKWVQKTNDRLMLCDKAYRIRFSKKYVLSQFTELLLNSLSFANQIEKLKTGINDSGVNINQDGFLRLLFPLPPLPEQKEIVRILEEQFEVIEQNECEIDASLKRAEALRQSILKRAFSGKLVAQDPNDEPASELLARIQAERDGEPAADAAESPANFQPLFFEGS